MMSKTILCYGDSNTFGLVGGKPEQRYAKDERWSGFLSELLMTKFDVIEDGLNNRNAFIHNPQGKNYCALEDLSDALERYKNIDIVILAVGTNDLQFTYDFNGDIVRNGLTNLVNIVEEYSEETKIIIVPPIKLGSAVESGYFNYQFNGLSINRSSETFHIYKELAKQYNCYYFDRL